MNGQRVIGITFVAILMLIAIVLLIQAGRFILGSNDSPDAATVEEQVVTERTITDFIDSEAVATFTNSGEIVNTEDYNRVEIEITPNSRELRIIRGYDNVVETRKSFANTDQAYDAFMHAIAFEGILAEKEAAFDTVDGVCPTGNRFEFNLNVDGNDDDLALWASSCTTRHGSFDGDRRGVQKLFEKQIPEYRELTRGLSL